ncbi:MAG TPA: hypothetical protein VGU20_11655 [Stellaceae bacterium]|nr:hypothetical protein [Stellaceae bacterium]
MDINKEPGHRKLMVSQEDVRDWRARTHSEPKRTAPWLVRFFTKLDPPAEEIPLSSLRWTRIAALAGIAALFAQLLTAPSTAPLVPTPTVVSSGASGDGVASTAKVGIPARIVRGSPSPPARKPGKLDFSDPDQSGLLPTLF